MGYERMCIRGEKGARCFQPFPENSHRQWGDAHLLDDAVQVAFGGGFGCMLTALGEVRCWGEDADGELGDGAPLEAGDPIRPLSTPWNGSPPPSNPKVVPGLPQAREVVTGSSHTCVLLTTNTVKCFGFNAYGQLGNGNQEHSSTPVAVKGLQQVAHLAAAGDHTCASRLDGTVTCWGSQPFDKGTAPLSRPTPIEVPGLTDVTGIASSEGDFDCALRANGTVACWGKNWATYKIHDTPWIVPDLGNVAEIAVGNTFACARVTDGTVRCWGSAFGGELGDGKMAGTDVPTRVLTVEGAVELALAGAAGCALTSTGGMWCWGSERPCARPAGKPCPGGDYPWTPIPIDY
jgi:alpha-tubulin suppressor-like RCC1 family protein